MLEARFRVDIRFINSSTCGIPSYSSVNHEIDTELFRWELRSSALVEKQHVWNINLISSHQHSTHLIGLLSIHYNHVDGPPRVRWLSSNSSLLSLSPLSLSIHQQLGLIDSTGSKLDQTIIDFDRLGVPTSSACSTILGIALPSWRRNFVIFIDFPVSKILKS